MKLASCKSALNPTLVYSAGRSKAVVPSLVLLFVALWFILRGDLLYVFPCVILFLCFSVLLVLRLPRLGKRELILVLFVRLFGLCLGSGKGCGLWLWHSLDFSLTLQKDTPPMIVFHVQLKFSIYCPFDISRKDVFFACRFILNENILFWLTIPNQKPFVFSVSVFCSQICTLKLNLSPKIGLTYAISIVTWFCGIFVLINIFLFSLLN